ncbi:hypothetical protein Tco_0945606 [Tanacetum coccineum]
MHPFVVNDRTKRTLVAVLHSKRTLVGGMVVAAARCRGGVAAVVDTCRWGGHGGDEVDMVLVVASVGGDGGGVM